MSLRRKVSRLPLRLAAGSYVLNSGLSKWSAEEPTAKQLQQFASGPYPFLAKLDAQTFVKALSATEITLGAALLLPFVPAALAGAGLAVFAGGLVGLYLKTPGMRQEGSVRPTEQGMALAKDVWLLSIGSSLVIDDLVSRGEKE